MATTSHGNESQRLEHNLRHAKRRKRRREWAQEYKRTRGCIVCGWGIAADAYEVEALQFDHLEGHYKFKDVSRMYTYSDHKFWSEIAKCQVICARCHAIREARRRTHYPGLTWQEAQAIDSKQLKLLDD